MLIVLSSGGAKLPRTRMYGGGRAHHLRRIVRSLTNDWRFEIGDCGGSVTEGQEVLVFRTFHIGERSSGSGLGLALVPGIARAHGGCAGAELRSGEPATFGRAGVAYPSTLPV